MKLYDWIKPIVVGATIYGTLSFAPLGVLGLRNDIIGIGSVPYSSNAALKNDIKKEKEKLGLQNVAIDYRFVGRVESGLEMIGLTAGAGVIEKGPHQYEIIFGNKCDLRTLKHEMWHVRELESGILKEKRNRFEGYAAEWRAGSYAAELPPVNEP